MSNQECGDRPNREIRAKQNLHVTVVMKVASSVCWPPCLMWKDMPASISHGVTFFAVLVALALIFVGMMASNSRGNVASSAPSSISDSGRQYLDELSRRANEMDKHYMFLRDIVPSLSRIGGHRHSCALLRGGNCSCNNGAHTFADYEDIEAQILKPGNINGVNNIRRVKPETACGLQNINHVFNTTHASDALDAAVSIGTVAPGQTRGTGNMLFCEGGGVITKTFGYLLRVLTAAFDLIAQLREAIALLVQKLCAADARNADLEARQADLEAHNRILVEQLRMNNQKCDDLAQRKSCEKTSFLKDLSHIWAAWLVLVMHASHARGNEELRRMTLSRMRSDSRWTETRGKDANDWG
jgi:hypothetical protein